MVLAVKKSVTRKSASPPRKACVIRRKYSAQGCAIAYAGKRMFIQPLSIEMTTSSKRENKLYLHKAVLVSQVTLNNLDPLFCQSFCLSARGITADSSNMILLPLVSKEMVYNTTTWAQA